MLQNGHINFFNVNKCGLYRHLGIAPKGLDLTTTFSKLKEWKEGRNFEATNPWDPQKNRNKTACYSHEIYHHSATGDFLLVLWKGDTDKNGPLYGITVNPDGTTEKAIEQTKTKSNKQLIWGRPCYYWVIPEINVIASVKFENSRCDSTMFQDWVSGCMNFRVQLPEFKVSSTDKGYTRIEFPEGEDSYKYFFQFDLSMTSLSTSSAEITDLAKRVTHIVRRETVSIKNVDKRKGFAKFFKRFEVPFASAADDSVRKVELRVEARPTPAEIKDIIEQHGTDGSSSAWEDVGFAVENSTRVVWASKYRLTESLSIEDGSDPVFKAEYLYAKLLQNRDRYLGPIRKDLLNSQAAENA